MVSCTPWTIFNVFVDYLQETYRLFARCMDNYQCLVCLNLRNFARKTIKNLHRHDRTIVAHAAGVHSHRARRPGHFPLLPCLLAEHPGRAQQRPQLIVCARSVQAQCPLVSVAQESICCYILMRALRFGFGTAKNLSSTCRLPPSIIPARPHSQP